MLDKETRNALVQIMTYTKKFDMDEETLNKLFEIYDGNAMLVALEMKHTDKLMQMLEADANN